MQQFLTEWSDNQTAYAASKQSLINQISKKKPYQFQALIQNQNAPCLHCTHCSRDNHKIEDCYHASKPKCTVCKKLGYKEDKCPFKKKTQKPCKSKDKKIAESSALKKETHIAKNGSDNEILAAIGNDHFMITDDPLIDNVFDYNIQYSMVILLPIQVIACMIGWRTPDLQITSRTGARTLAHMSLHWKLPSMELVAKLPR